jgi:hypothetical protein
MDLPIRIFQELYHFGTMNIEDRKNISYEGNTLSVSLHPASWMQIMEESNFVFKTEEEKRLVDIHEFVSSHQKDIIEWSLLNKLIEPKKIFQVFYYDSESDEISFMSFNDKDEALKEVENDDFLETSNKNDIKDILKNYTHVILDFNGYIYTENGMKEIRQNENIVEIDTLAILFLENIKEEYNIDGCWWNNNLNPNLFTAPSGGLFLNNIHHEKWKKVNYSLDLEDEENIKIPDIKRQEYGI